MKKTTVLIVGVGSIGERHLRCFGHTDRAELSICEINDSLRQQIAERYSVSRAVRNLNEVLDEPPDVAVICTAAHLHVPMAIRLPKPYIRMTGDSNRRFRRRGVVSSRSTGSSSCLRLR